MVIPGAAGDAVAELLRFGLGGDLRLGVNEPVLGGSPSSGASSTGRRTSIAASLPADPVTFGRNYREFGFYVGLTQDLGPHLQTGIRYDFYNPDADSVNRLRAATKSDRLRLSTVAVRRGLALVRSGRLIAEYDLNRNHNGRTPRGSR